MALVETLGLLVLAGMPIGDVEDASPALLRAIATADVIAAEDTRRFQAFLVRAHATSTGRVVSYFEGNESGRTPELVDLLRQGLTVVLVTDAGMPSVSDPGYRLVAASIEAGIRVTAVPGPSAVLTALAVSGLATDRFCFEGFLPRKAGPRRAVLVDAASVLGEQRPAAVCRELTKTYEEVRRGGLAELARWAAEGVLGEITVVVAGVPASDRLPLSDAVDEVRQRVADGEKRSAAAAAVAAATGHDRRELYDGSRG